MEKLSVQDQISSNQRKTYFLIFIFIVLIMVVGYAFGLFLSYFLGWYYLSPYIGLGIATILAIVLVTVQYYRGDKLILRMTKVRPATNKEFPAYVHAVEGIAIAAGIPTPKMYVTNDTAMNAFATGRDPEHASIVATTGLIKKLNRLELEGVVAHEISHIKNRDIKIMMLAAVLVGIVVLIGDFAIRMTFYSRGHRGGGKDQGTATAILLVVAVVAIIVAPLVAQLIKMAISRKREYLADASGAFLTRYPEGLASALEKLDKDKEPLEVANKATAHLYIDNPFTKEKVMFSGLFSTHPPIAKRIKRLRAM